MVNQCKRQQHGDSIWMARGLGNLALFKSREFGEYPERTIPSQASKEEGVTTIPTGSTFK